MNELERFINGYVTCAIWSTFGDDGEPLDKTFDAGDLAPDTNAKIAAECAVFMEVNADALTAYYAATGRDESSAGHDFWLTRNGHGAGFWDRGAGEPGDRLSDAARAEGECWLHPGDDGRLYL